MSDTPTERIKQRRAETLYVRKGHKYVAVSDPWATAGLREGWWLIKVDRGSTSIRQQIWPDQAPLTAAARELEDKLVALIREACEARPNKTPLSPDEKRDWEWFIKKHGESFNTLHYPSFAGNAEKIVKILLDQVTENT